MRKIMDKNYVSWIGELKQKFQQAQIKAAVQVNRALLEFYWNLGSEIVDKEKRATWGSGFMKQVSDDLRAEFLEVKGFSYENLRYVKRWYLFYTTEESNLGTSCSQIDTEVLFQIPWGQNLVIISKCKNKTEAFYYAKETIQNGWSRAILGMQIESKLYEREGKGIHNFDIHLPKPQSDLAKQLLKDPFNFEFLTLTKDFQEVELERGLVTHITQFLLELGQGFAYVGKQVKITIEDENFYLDLLFYHLKLRCHVVIELKAVAFMPEFAGKLNFYLSAVDEQLKHPSDNPTIGILLCKSKKKTIVEYALRNMDTPIGVSEYQITQALPENLKSALPSVAEIEAELDGINLEIKKNLGGLKYE